MLSKLSRVYLCSVIVSARYRRRSHSTPILMLLILAATPLAQGSSQASRRFRARREKPRLARAHQKREADSRGAVRGPHHSMAHRVEVAAREAAQEVASMHLMGVERGSGECGSE